MASLSLRHIYKKYPGGVTAVSDFNLEVKDKEFLVLVGPSGCGKTTTLRMIAGLEEITEGELFIGDRLVNDVAPKDREIAMVFQNYALYPHMSVFENMAFGLKLNKVPKEKIKRLVEEAARVLDITHLLDRKPKALSGGQKQRVALGRAIVREPKVFLLDEPLSNLDAKLRAAMRTELTKLHKRVGTTFVYVTHDQVEAMTMATRIVVMKDGLIQQVDTPQKLYDYPCNIFVAGFLGTPQMNFINVNLLRVKTVFTLSSKTFLLNSPRRRQMQKNFRIILIRKLLSVFVLRQFLTPLKQLRQILNTHSRLTLMLLSLWVLKFTFISLLVIPKMSLLLLSHVYLLVHSPEQGIRSAFQLICQDSISLIKILKFAYFTNNKQKTEAKNCLCFCYL